MQNKVAAFAPEHSLKQRVYRIQPARGVFLFVLAIAAVTLLATSSFATGNISKGDLTGPWVVSLVGNTGCGLGTMQANFALNGSGTGTATITTHAQCGDSVTTGQTFTVITLGANGAGTAGLTCGSGCGWTFNIQVAPDRSTFSLVDVSTANPLNYLAGMAVHQ